MSITEEYGMIYYICSSITTILCIFLKFPQLLKVIQTKSCFGLSKQSLILELWAYLTVMSYSLSFGYPFSIYAEYPFLVIQNLVLLLLVLHFDKTFTKTWLLSISMICLIHGLIALRLTMEIVPIILIQIGTPIGWYSKALQCWTILSNKNSGQVSSLTWTLNTISTAARFITYLISIWDNIIIISLFVSMFLNASVAISAYKYSPKIKRE